MESKTQNKECTVKVITKIKLTKEESQSHYKREERWRPTLNEYEAKVYPFPDLDVPMILDEFVFKKVINLHESKSLKEINKVGDPCKFHRVLGHRTSKCFILKEKIMMLVSEGKLIIYQDEIAEENHANVAPNKNKWSSSPSIPNTTFLRFGSLTHIEVDVPRKFL